MRDAFFLLGRLAIVALYFESAVGKFGDLSSIAGGLAAKGFPSPMLFAAVAAGDELAEALGVASGLYTRVAALGLVVFTEFATVLFHDFWAVEAAARQAQFLHFMKNLGLAGGLLVVAGVGAGRLSLDGLRASRRPGRRADRTGVTQ